MATRRLSGMTTSASVPDNGGDHSGGGGSAGGYVDDVFSTYLWKGNGGDRDIVNGVDLDGEGGMVWIKSREDTSGGATAHLLQDTERGVTKWLSSDSPNQQATATNLITAFNSNGFSLGGGSYWANENQVDYTSWTFRKARSFFDVVTYTGDDVQGREIPHNLGVAPGMIIVKRLTGGDNWQVFHKDLSNPLAKRLYLNSELAEQNQSSPPQFPAMPTDSVFTVGKDASMNDSTQEYVAYLFAHDDSDEGMIQCGSYTGTGAAGNEIDLGWEPQMVMIKGSSHDGGWNIFDSMRGVVTNGNDPYLSADTSLKSFENKLIRFTATGFSFEDGWSETNMSSRNYIYMAIRRPNKPAGEFEAEELFNTVSGRDDGKSPSFELGFPADMAIQKAINGSADGHYIFSRPTGDKFMFTDASSEESAGSNIAWDYMDGVLDYFDSDEYNAWGWRRAHGFFDVVPYEGDGQAGREVPHSLGVAPEMMWIKVRDRSNPWPVYNKDLGNNAVLYLNTNAKVDTSDRWYYTTPTESVFTLHSDVDVNRGSSPYIAYLFASVPGICDIGTYTGNGPNGTTQDIDCGFTNGARFVLIKRTDGTGNWMYFDVLRGGGGVNLGFPLALNTTDAQLTTGSYAYVIPSGFRVNTYSVNGDEWNTNLDGAEYIYMAIA